MNKLSPSTQDEYVKYSFYNSRHVFKRYKTSRVRFLCKELKGTQPAHLTQVLSNMDDVFVGGAYLFYNDVNLTRKQSIRAATTAKRYGFKSVYTWSDFFTRIDSVE